MKLLFDENLSPQLVRLLSDLFPDSVHVREVGLKAADDPIVWKYAQEHDLIICSKDSDMHQQFPLRLSTESGVGAIGQLLHFRRREFIAETLRCG
jgi:predicted nuclease of predicted toxin-antitoxin system